MTDQSVVPAVRALGTEDEKGFSRIALAIAAPCRRDVSQLVSMLRSDKQQDSQKAAAVLQSLGSVAYPTLLESLDRSKPEDYVWEIQLLADIEADSRGRLLRELEAVLADKRDVKQPDLGPGVEEKPIPRRVCDEAYLLLRRMLIAGESEDAQYLGERAFLNREDKEKDQEIQRYKQTRKWVPLTD